MKELLEIFHTQNKKTIHICFYLIAAFYIIGFLIDTPRSFNEGEILPAYLNIVVIAITVISTTLFISKKIKIHLATALFTYCQLCVSVISIVYFTMNKTLVENQYSFEVVLQILNISMIGYIVAPKHALIYGSISLTLNLFLIFTDKGETVFKFLPIYGFILIGFSVIIFFFIKQSIISFSNNYKNTQTIKKQAAAIFYKNKEIKKLNLLQKDLTNMIVHDLKNPLNTILSKSKDPTVIHSGRKMLNLVMNILDVEKYENSHFKINKEIFSITEIIKKSILNIKFLAEQKNININYPSEDYLVFIDAEIIERVVENILNNAIRFSPQNKSIDIFITEKQKNKLTISIRNYGEKIPEDKIESIFDKYQHSENSNTSLYKSSGIGLTFCRMAIEAHQQTIIAKNCFSEGVLFEFTLDKKEKSKSPPAALININNCPQIDKEKIASHLAILNQYQIHSASEIISVLKTIPENSPDIRSWKNKVKLSVFASNHELYKKLIMISKK